MCIVLSLQGNVAASIYISTTRIFIFNVLKLFHDKHVINILNISRAVTRCVLASACKHVASSNILNDLG